MTRIKITLPESYQFSCKIPVRITDLNYGGHMGNDKFLSIAHEARVQYFKSLGYTELSFAGNSFIMTDAAIEFKAEFFQGDVIAVSLGITDVSHIGFNLVYKLQNDATSQIAAVIKTGMICFDYEKRKIVALSEKAKKALTGQ
jgi:YbgC/YbaW family acyl-CoA thioester hydrolase